MFDGCVIIFDSSVFGGFPKCASIGFILVVVFGIGFIDSMTLATIVAKSEDDYNWLCSSTANPRFIVCNKQSTTPLALWLPAGASISSMFLFLQKMSKSRALNACAWSHLIDRGLP